MTRDLRAGKGLVVKTLAGLALVLALPARFAIGQTVAPIELDPAFQADYTNTACGSQFEAVTNPLRHWVAVQSTANGSEPPPVTLTGSIRESFPNFFDSPYDHESHDFNFYVELDPQYLHLNSPANAKETIDGRSDVQLMEMEWEQRYFPKEYWPAKGDRVWMRGRYIWDCGHPPFHSEIHPPEAVAFTRFAPTPFSGDPDTHPSVVNKTYFYASGRGGYYPSRGKALSLDGHAYTFDIPLPPKPSATAVWRFEELKIDPYTGASPALGDVQVSAPAPIYAQDPPKDPASPVAIRVTVTTGSPDAAGAFGRVFLAGWREDAPTLAFCHLQVALNSIKINAPHLTPGDIARHLFKAGWQMWAQVGDRWLELLRTDDAPGLPKGRDNGSVGLGDIVSLAADPADRQVDAYTPIRPVRDTLPDADLIAAGMRRPDGVPIAVRTSGWKSNLIDTQFGLTVPSSVLGLLRAVATNNSGWSRLWNEPSLIEALYTSGVIPGTADVTGQDSLIGQVERTSPPDDSTVRIEDEFGVRFHDELSEAPASYPFEAEETGQANPETTADFHLYYDVKKVKCGPSLELSLPLEGYEGQELIVFGRRFDPTAAKNLILFPSQRTAPIEVPADQVSPGPPDGQGSGYLQVKVPKGAVTGPLGIRTGDGEFSTAGLPLSVRDFHLTYAKPEVTDFSPTSGVLPLVLIVNGKHLGSIEEYATYGLIGGGRSAGLSGASSLYGTLRILSASDTQLVLLLEGSGVKTGPIQVSSPGGTAQSTDLFTVLPPPASGPAPMQGATILVNSTATGDGTAREMTIAKAIKFASGTLGRALSVRPYDQYGHPIYDPNDSTRPYEDEQVQGDEVMAPIACIGFDGKPSTCQEPTGTYRSAGAGFRDTILACTSRSPISADLCVGGTFTIDSTLPPMTDGDILNLNGSTLQGAGGAGPGLTLKGDLATVVGPGNVTGFTTAGVLVTGGRGINVGSDIGGRAPIDVSGNSGAGVRVDGAPDARLMLAAVDKNGGPGIDVRASARATISADSASSNGAQGLVIADSPAGAVSLGASSGNKGQGILVTGEKSLGTHINVVVAGADPAAGTAGNQRGIEFGGGATGVTVQAASVNGSAAEGILFGESTRANRVRLAALTRNGKPVPPEVSGSGADGAAIVKSPANNLVILAGSIHDNAGEGLRITGPASTENRIEGPDLQQPNDVSGLSKNKANGIKIDGGAAHNQIVRLLVAGNGENGVLITDPGSDGELITGCVIGGDPSKGLANHLNGVSISAGSKDNWIGGPIWLPHPSVSNVIAGNGQNGVLITGDGTRNNSVRGNYIGSLKAIPELTFPNAANGVLITGGASENYIGRPSPLRPVIVFSPANNFILKSNIISGNAAAGIRIEGVAATGNHIEGNAHIGTDEDLTANPNRVGIEIFKAKRNFIGAEDLDGWNSVAGNTEAGIRLDGAEETMVINNMVGLSTRFDPLSDLITTVPNDVGIELKNDAARNRIGGIHPGETNFIGGNKTAGVLLTGVHDTSADGTGFNPILGNLIGVKFQKKIAGFTLLPNGTGVRLEKGTSGQIIGMETPFAPNIISGNTDAGVAVADAESTGNRITSNRIGTDDTGTSSIGTTQNGVEIRGATETLLDGNLISANGGYGIVVSLAKRTRLEGNVIGIDASGTGQLANGKDGVYAINSPDTRIGSARNGNLISGNKGNGIYLSGAGSSAARIWENRIGPPGSGAASLPNGGDGIRIDNGASAAAIGGMAPIGKATIPAPNVIEDNIGFGVDVSGAGTVGNTLTGNDISGNVKGGIATTAGGNNGISPPSLVTINPNSGAVQITVDRTKVPDGSTIELFSDPGTQGMEYLGSETIVNGKVAGTIPLPLTGNLTGTVTSASTGDTSEFAVPIPPPPPPPLAFLRVAAEPGPPDAAAPADARGVALLDLDLATGIAPVAVTGLTLSMTGSASGDSLLAASLQEHGAAGQPDPAPVAGTVDATARTVVFKILETLPAASAVRWHIQADLSGRAMAGQTVRLAVKDPASVPALLSPSKAPVPVIGGFPAQGPAFTLTTAAGTGHPGAGPPGSGDVNGDGKVNVSDAILVLQGLVGTVTLTPEQRAAADLNGGGKLTVADAVAILRKAVGL